MERHGEAMSFIADHLNQMEHRRMMVEHDRIVFLSVDVDDLFALGDRSKREVDDLEGLERLCCRVKLPDAAIDQYEARQALLFFLQPFVTPRHYFAHGGEVIHAFDGL